MIYLLDGKKETFLTAFLLAYRDEEALFAEKVFQLALGQRPVRVQADPARAKRAEQRLLQLDARCMRDLDLLLRSGETRRLQIALAYFRLIAARKGPVRGMAAEDAVAEACDCMRRVTLEAHRLKGFVRFSESASGALYAPLAPDNDVCDLLMPHFCLRLGKIPFVLHDVARQKAAVWDGHSRFSAPLERATVLLSADEDGWQALWKRYYRSVNIPSRERIRQMKQYLPVRYWKFMPEMRD